MAEYSLHDYGSMIQDGIRTAAYARALERAVRPGSVVLDIGAGSGMFAMLAARAGARRVFAVEPENPIELARELATANGLADRITFIKDLSARITLPEPADVVVSDLHGVLPLHRGHLPAIADARERHLAADGALIPFRETLWVAPVELAGVYEQRVSAWEAAPYGLDLARARFYAANDWLRVNAPAEGVLAAPARLAAFDYRSWSSPNLSASAELISTRGGTLHGLAVWFDSELAEGVAFSNAPGEPESIYGQGFFPLLEPVELDPGDVISVAFAASLLGDDYVFRWDTRVAAAAAPGGVKGSFKQSTLFAAPFSPETLARASEDYVAERTEEGDAVAFVLERLDGARALGDISREVEGEFPELARSAGDALALVTKVTQKYGR